MSKKDKLFDTIRESLKDFDWAEYGCDDINEIIADPRLDLLEALTIHVYNSLNDA